MKKKGNFFSGLGIIFGVLFLYSGLIYAAPNADLWEKWEAHNSNSNFEIDHQIWQDFLDKYLVNNHPSGVNRLRYKDIDSTQKERLGRYINQLSAIKIHEYNRKIQKAYWINFYNALTVRVILDHYPVGSIMDIDISPGFFSNGPWDAKLVQIEGSKVSLNDMEHRILRPIWKDNRIHYAVNCASIGCPNLSPEAFDGKNNERLLNQAAQAYINHERGVLIIGTDDIKASSIFDWYAVDFGDSEKSLVQHWLKYAKPELKTKLLVFDGNIDYDYNWKLNEP